MFVTLNGITMHFQMAGKAGGRPMVFINSLGTDLHIWDGVVPPFFTDFRILRYDKRGHGLSDAPKGPYRITDHSDDLERLMERLDLNGAIVVAVSVGGMIALQLAAEHPQRVSALVLCDTGTKLGSDAFWNGRIQAINKDGLDVIAPTVLARWFAPTFAQKHPDSYRGYQNMLNRTPVAGYIGTCAAIRDADLKDAASLVRQPTLVLFGADDASTPPKVGRELASMMFDGTMELVDDAGHLPCVEQPEVVTARIARFLKEKGYG